TAINVRAGPGTDYPVVGQLQPGQEARVMGRNEDTSWWQVSLGDAPDALGWVAGQLVTLSGDNGAIPVAAAPPPPPTATPAPQAEASNQTQQNDEEQQTPEELEAQLQCGKDFCITYQAMLTIGENGGCIGNHSIFITVLQGPPPGTPMNGVVIGDTFNNVEVASGDKGPGTAEITLWSNTMSVKAKRNIDGTPYTSEESYPFTSQDELIPAEVLAANGYCDGSVEKCRWAQQNNQVCRGHYSYRVTFHKFD
ncbi:MAG: SH3 domain-containing protein, partial [Chloroflexi bacterium]|nr:SH3 domain-containing protein [Chloroflexota bacterium]